MSNLLFLVDRSLISDEYIQYLRSLGYCMSRALVERCIRPRIISGFPGDRETYLVYSTNIVIIGFISKQRAFFDTEYMYQLEWDNFEWSCYLLNY